MSRSGSKIASQNRPYLRLFLGLALVALFTVSYLLDETNYNYADFFQNSNRKSTRFFQYFNNSVINETETQDGYLIWSPSCRIPDIPPFHESIQKFYGKKKLPNCKNLPFLTSVERDTNGTHRLILHKQHVKRYTSWSKPKCCYAAIERTDLPENSTNLNADDVYSIGKCIEFNDDVILSEKEQFIRVNCSVAKGKAKKEVYTNAHAFVTKKEKIIEKIKNLKQKQSVMIFGIDSISRLNLIRTMPKTVEFLTNTGWFSLNGYNKIADNTFPNLMAILTGSTVSQISHTCWPSRDNILDNCPLIWKNYSDKGYVTAYAEDEPTIGSFNYHKTGFLKSPTDYYLRPFMLAATKTLKIKRFESLDLCFGPSYVVDHMLNYALEFSNEFVNVPTFSLFWLNSFSHSDLNTPTTMDKRILNFFKDLAKIGTLNTTFIIFLSDHGIRFGKIRETYVGYMEERLPFIYFWAPQEFQKSNAEKIKNLEKNKNRLTSPFDLHLTLTELMGDKKYGTPGCSECTSLFDEINWNRTCTAAGITSHWCACGEYTIVSKKSKVVDKIVSSVLKEINQIVVNASKYLNNGTKCAKIELNQVVSVRNKVFSNKIDYEEYVILLQTKPGDAIFEATVAHNKKFQIMDSISRVNAYDKQSSCMNDSYAKKYCFCEI